MQIKIFNHGICVCVLLDTNSFMRKMRRKNEENYDHTGWNEGIGY